MSAAVIRSRMGVRIAPAARIGKDAASIAAASIAAADAAAKAEE
jgi:hypothetical protein